MTNLTENDRLLLIAFKKARDLYNDKDILVRFESAEHLGKCLTALQYLDDPELNAVARIARLEFDEKEPPKNLVEATKAAEDKLIAAINDLVPE
jgi:hypothetical protein